MASAFLRQGIKQASILIGVFTIASQLFGLVREAIVANFFGTSAEYDILLVALAIPMMVTSILFAAIPSAAIPYLQNSGITGGKKISIFKSKFFSINSLLIITVTIIVFLVLPLFKNLLVKGMDPESANLVIWFGRLFCLIIPFRAYEALFRSLLNYRHHFIFPTVNAIGFNLVAIIILLSTFASLKSYALVLALLSGMLVQTLLVTIPAYFIYRRNQIPGETSSFLTGNYLKFLGVIILIESIGLTVDPFDRYLGGIFLEPGYVSATYYANIIYYIPLRIVIYSLVIAIFPTLSESAVENNTNRMASLYHKALAVCVMLIIPTVVFFSLFKNEIIWLLFERGKFVIESRIITVEFLSFLLLGLFFHSVFLIQAKVFYAMKSWRFFIIVRMMGIALKVVIGFLFIKSNWALALGGGTALLFTFVCIAMEIYLVFRKKFYYSPEDRKLLRKAFLSSAGTVVIILLSYFILVELTVWHHLIIAVVVGLLGYAFMFVTDQKMQISGLNIRKLLKRE